MSFVLGGVALATGIFLQHWSFFESYACFILLLRLSQRLAVQESRQLQLLEEQLALQHVCSSCCDTVGNEHVWSRCCWCWDYSCSRRRCRNAAGNRSRTFIVQCCSSCCGYHGWICSIPAPCLGFSLQQFKKMSRTEMKSISKALAGLSDCVSTDISFLVFSSAQSLFSS